MKRLFLAIALLLLVTSVSAAYYDMPENNDTYVKATSLTSVNYYPYFGTDGALSEIGTSVGTSWASEAASNNSQRFHMDLGSAKPVNEIYLSNFHESGTLTHLGVRNFTFWGSNISDSFTNLTYSNDTGWTQITTVQTAFSEHPATNTISGQTLQTTIPAVYRYYGFKFADNYGDTTSMGLRHIMIGEIFTWGYTTQGANYWVCPVNVTAITVLMVGGGGSGRPGSGVGGPPTKYAGYGGNAGESSVISTVAVTPGTNYTLVIGSPGATATYENTSNPGTASSAFGYSMDGGDGGLIKYDGTAGGNGGNGAFSTSIYSVDGTSNGGFVNGLGGSGYGAGGGGSGAGAYWGPTGNGGAGAPGYIGIYVHGYYGGNVPQFSGTPVTGVAGTLVTFTDLSTVTNSTGLSYLWDFGDGSTSTTMGDVVHVYSFTGSYTVSLTLINGDGTTVTETKPAYINFVTEENKYILPTQPKSVRFKIVDAFGSDLPGALVTVNYINSSLPNTNISWLVSTFGVSTSVAAEMMNSGIAMQGTTGSDGGLSFIMYPVLQYNITITNATAGLSKTVSLYPQDTDYIIKCELTSQVQGPTRVAQLVNSTLYVTEPNASFIVWNIIYQDNSGYTTNVTWNVTCWSNMTEMHTKTWNAVGTNILIDNYTFPSTPVGMEYRALYDATRSTP